MKPIRAVAATSLWLLLGLVTAVHAQGVQTGIVRGTVRDSQGLAVPGVTVTVTSPALQGERTAVTDEEGAYVIRLLPAGEYKVQYSLSGFAPIERQTIVPLGGAAEDNVTMRPAGVTTTVDVTATTDPLADPVVGLNIRQDEVEALATSRTLQGIATLSPGLNDNTPNTRQLSINGANAFDNIFMLNGVDVNDNLFGSPQNLFIEDAIEETQVLTSGISAEFGRFSGGVVNAVTKSGGNRFAGSFRINLTNPSWTEETPFEDENGVNRQSKTNDTYEITFGGPILRDKIWFFGASRLAYVNTTETFDQLGLPYQQEDNNWRAEFKVTATPKPNHTVQGGYLNNHRELVDTPSLPFSIDPSTLTNVTIPNWYAFGNYRGVLRSNVLAEGQYSERRYKTDGQGGTSPAIRDSPFRTLTQALAQYNAPYFDATDPEQRNNRQLTGSATFFLTGAGHHELKGGYEWFRSQNVGGNSQSSTSYVFAADYLEDANGNPVVDSTNRPIPIFPTGGALLQHWIATRGATLNVDNNSFYAQNHWTINANFSADLGVRYERVRSEATGGIVGVDTDTIVPRLALAYDPKGDGKLVFHTTYGHYSGRYNEALINATSNVGNPALTLGIYTGPTGQGLDFAAGLNPANYQTVFGNFPTANVFFDDGLSAPITKEFTVSGGFAAGAKAYGEATYVWRSTNNFIEDYIQAQNGFTDVVQDGIDYGTFTNIDYRNTGDDAERHYQAAIFQGRYRVLPNWNAYGAWTIQLQNEGNYEGQAANQPAIPTTIGDFPEAFDPNRNFPIGRLGSYQRHRVRLWTIYDLDAKKYGDFSFSALWRIESGQAYSLVATSVPLTSIQEARLSVYPDAPVDQDLYFGERGSELFPGYAVMDFSVNYRIPVFRSLSPWLKLDLFNAFNNRKQIGFDTTVLPDFAGPVDALGLPLNFIRDNTFGEARGTGDFPKSLGDPGGRSFRMSFGVRF
jgi:hypothetical protein